MQMVAAVKRRQKLVRMLRISNYAVKIDDRVEQVSSGSRPPGQARSADPAAHIHTMTKKLSACFIAKGLTLTPK